MPEGFDDADLAELFISGPVTRGEMLAVSRTSDEKCGRCAEVVDSMDAVA